MLRTREQSDDRHETRGWRVPLIRARDASVTCGRVRRVSLTERSFKPRPSVISACLARLTLPSATIPSYPPPSSGLPPPRLEGVWCVSADYILIKYKKNERNTRSWGFCPGEEVPPNRTGRCIRSSCYMRFTGLSHSAYARFYTQSKARKDQHNCP